MAPRKGSEPAGAIDPDSLVREEAGRYRSGDGRFEVQQSGTSWFLLDSAHQNEFGQDLIHGPFPSLKAVREQIPAARNVKPSPRSRARPAAPRRATPRRPPRRPPPTWIDRLPPQEASAVRRIIAALEREGIADAETLVRRDHDSAQPAVVARLIERRLEQLVEELPEHDRDGARQLIGRAAEILSGVGTTLRDPLPRWLLVELPAGHASEPTNRRIRIRQ